MEKSVSSASMDFILVKMENAQNIHADISMNKVFVSNVINSMMECI